MLAVRRRVGGAGADQLGGFEVNAWSIAVADAGNVDGDESTSIRRSVCSIADWVGPVAWTGSVDASWMVR